MGMASAHAFREDEQLISRHNFKKNKNNKQQKRKMKQLKNLMMLCLGFIAVAMSFASCMNSDDDSLDPVEQKQYMTMMAGSYQGKLRFYYPKTSSYTGNVEWAKYDSIPATWTAGADSSIVIRNFPVYMLDSAVVVDNDEQSFEAEKYRSLSKAISELKESDPTVTFLGQYAIPSKAYVSNAYYQFAISGYTISKTLSFDGAAHTVYFVFGQTTGSYILSSRTFQGQVGLYAICIDKLDLSSQYVVPSRYFKQVQFTFSAK